MQNQIFSQVPTGAVIARIQAAPGQAARLVSLAGIQLSPSAFRLVFQVSGAGGWLVLVPVSSSSFHPVQAAAVQAPLI